MPRYPGKPKNLSTLREIITFIDESLAGHTAFINSSPETFPSMDYLQVKNTVLDLVQALLSLDVNKGDKIALLSENRTEWALVYLAAVCMGCVIVPLDILLTPQELENLIKDSQAKILFVSASQKDRFPSQESLPVKHIVVFDPIDETRALQEKKEAQDLLTKLLGLSILPSKISKTLSLHKQELVLTDKCEVLFREERVLDFLVLVTAGKHIRSENCSNPLDNIPLSPDDPAALIYTSGTTGKPKAVLLTQYNLASNVDDIQMHELFAPEFRWVTLLPLHHTFPTMGGLLVPFVTRGTIRFVASLRSDVIINAFKETRVNCIIIVPLFLEKIYKNILKTVKEKNFIVRFIFKTLFNFSHFVYKWTHLNPGKILFHNVREKLGLSELKFFISGGGPIAKEILIGLNSLGIYVAQGYGLSETSPVLTCSNLTVNKFGSVGFPLKRVELRIDNPDKRGHGEILARGPNIMKGYLNNPEETAKVIESEGWFHTGDIGFIDKQGFLWITGRLKNIIVTSGGKNIYPEELENLLAQSEYIAEVAVIGRKDWESRGEVPYAIIYPNLETIKLLSDQQEKNFDEDSLYELFSQEIKRLTADLPLYKKIADFELIYEELPKTSSKKIKRFLLEASKPFQKKK
ncbi:AMP-dependent synthetase/ligase [Thermospira aquatica]|uniref:AMP-binding protein n=1 Tax=Thermospira aquatica TaxID=2828656 RepID=A0AAX3BBN0_9SPIR|nr:AMP-binding protein [Thermospira aquatica]URA09635.1 AMP-binding protein [Thermospira aquatica]